MLNSRCDDEGEVEIILSRSKEPCQIFQKPEPRVQEPVSQCSGAGSNILLSVASLSKIKLIKERSKWNPHLRYR